MYICTLYICTYFGAKPTFAHTQRTHPNNIVYLSSEEEWKHWLYAGILSVVLWELGFWFRVLGFRLLKGLCFFFGFCGFRLCKVEKTLTLRMDLSMSRDMRDPMRANVGFAANMFQTTNQVGMVGMSQTLLVPCPKMALEWIESRWKSPDCLDLRFQCVQTSFGAHDMQIERNLAALPLEGIT